MKKVIFSFAFLAALLAGCQRPELVEQVDAPTFLADVEEFGSRTKTSMTSERKVIWTKNDRVAIFHKSTQAREYVLVDDYAGGSNGKFNVVSSGASIAGDALPCNVALYPYSDELALEVGVSDDVASYTISNVNLPAIQNYAPNSFGGGAFPMAAVTGSVDDRNLKFKNVLGVLKLSLKGTQTVMSIMVEGKNGELLSGAAEILLLSTNSNPQITMTSEDQESHYVTLDCGEGVHLSNAVATDFYITLPPATYTEGFKVTVTDSDSETHVLEATTSNTVIRSSILLMPEISLGGSDEEHPGGEDSSSENDYVDEYGINHGEGVEIDGVVWAPVNCGYHATDYKWGKLYQWGRKYGQGYEGQSYDGDWHAMGWITDYVVPEISTGCVSFEEGQLFSNQNIFYTGSQENNKDWLFPQADFTWNTGSEECPEKTIFDPCPSGWRVPTLDELRSLTSNASEWIIDNDGLNGRWFSGSCDYSSVVSQVFLPAAGARYESGNASGRGNFGSYWSSAEQFNVISFSKDVDGAYGHDGRANGNSVRCVQNVYKDDSVENERLTVPAMRFEFDTFTLTLNEGETYQMKATVYPDYTTDKTIWSSDDTSVASIDESGLITAIGVGTATISVTAGCFSATCSVEVKRLYLDEYGINHGHGVKIGSVVWAPVNCGYKAPIIGDAGFVIDAGYPYGKLYQWGRKYGQGYSGYLYGADGSMIGEVSDHTIPNLNDDYYDYITKYEDASMSELQSESNANEFYLGLTITYGWRSHTSKNGDYDPCPNGWRVPNHEELDILFTYLSHSSWVTNDEGQPGYWFYYDVEYSETSPQIFLPAAGYRDLTNGYADLRGLEGNYWSACGWENSAAIGSNYQGKRV